MIITDKNSFELLLRKMLTLVDDKKNRRAYIFRDKMIVRTDKFFVSHCGENYCETENDEVTVIDEEMKIDERKTSVFEGFFHHGVTMMCAMLRNPSGYFCLDFSDKIIPTVNESAVLFIVLKEKLLRVEYENGEYDIMQSISDPNDILRIQVPALPTLGIVDLSPDKKVHFEIFPQFSENSYILKFALSNGYRGFIRGKADVS
jgi:hypothetical protein